MRLHKGYYFSMSVWTFSEWISSRSIWALITGFNSLIVRTTSGYVSKRPILRAITSTIWSIQYDSFAQLIRLPDPRYIYVLMTCPRKCAHYFSVFFFFLSLSFVVDAYGDFFICLDRFDVCLDSLHICFPLTYVRVHNDFRLFSN